MRRQILSSLLVGAAGLVSFELRAQQPAPPNLDAVPEKMPFSTAYGPPIGAKRANAVIEAEKSKQKKGGEQRTGATPYCRLSHVPSLSVMLCLITG